MPGNRAKTGKCNETTWKPGQSGNPNGRPKVAQEFREWCRDVMSEKGRAKLETAIDNEESPFHFKALALVAAYAYGRPPQHQHITSDGSPVLIVDLLTPDKYEKGNSG